MTPLPIKNEYKSRACSSFYFVSRVSRARSNKECAVMSVGISIINRIAGHCYFSNHQSFILKYI